MNKKGVILGIVLILAVNGLVLAGAAYNRLGFPGGEILLSEREIHAPFRFNSSDENSGITFRIHWNASGKNWEWFDRKKLEELGFDLRAYDNNSGEEKKYRKTILPKKAFAVLELDGEARARYLEEKKKEMEKIEQDFRLGLIKKEAVIIPKRKYNAALKTESRLFIVDVGKDPVLLRKRFADRSSYLILPAEVRTNIIRWNRTKTDGEGKPKVTGIVSKLLPGTIHVPRKYHSLLYKAKGISKKTAKGYSTPQGESSFSPFEVVLKTGKRNEVWIGEIRQRVE